MDDRNFSPPAAAMPAAIWSRMAETLPHYEIHVTLKPESQNMSVDVKVTLPSATMHRTSLQFKLLPNMGTPQVRLIAPKAAGTLTVRKVREEGDELHPRAIWEIEPETAFPANQPVSLHIVHSGGDKHSQNHYVGIEIVLASGINQPWYPQFSDGKALGSLSLDIPSSFFALATGERASERVREGRRYVDFEMKLPTKFGFTAAPYKVYKSSQKKSEIPVAVYLLRDLPYATDLIDIAQRSIATLEKEFGNFPFKEFAVGEMPDKPGIPGGTSLDGYILMRSDHVDLMRADPFFFGHEVSHQWWGVSISPDGAGKQDEKGLPSIVYMINEALAQYGALRVIEAVCETETAKAFRDEQREHAINLIAAGEDEPLASLPNGSTYYELSQAKGCLVYDLISQAVGMDRLRRFFHEVTAIHNYSSLTSDEYVTRLKNAVGTENQWLIDQWFYQKGLPILDLKWTLRQDEVVVVISQQNIPHYLLQIPVRLVYVDGSAEMRSIEVAAQAEMIAVLPIEKSVSRVELDPERTVLWASPQEFATALAIKDATRAWSHWDNAENADAEKILKAALDARTAPDATPAEFLERYNYGWLIEEDYNNLPEALDQYMRALQLPVRDEKKLPQLYLNIARVASAINDKSLADWTARAAIALVKAVKKEDARAKRIREQAQRYLR